MKALSVILLSLLPASGQFRMLATIEVEAAFLTSDNLHNFYVITRANTLVKYSPEGVKTFDLDIKSLGALTFADARNPMKVLAFFPEFGNVLTLDNRLTETSRVNLFDLGITRVSAVCRSYDDNFWVFDEQDFRLKKISESSVSIESDIISSFVTADEIRPVFMQEENDYVYLCDPQIGVMVFDIYGTYSRMIPVTGITFFQVRDDLIFFLRNGRLFSYNTRTFEESLIDLPPAAYSSARIEKGMIYLLSGNRVDLLSAN